ncbi:MAG: hypothetical protein GY940_41560, partial [bacterium]|nr:hypothetical protein [bacterium]
MEELLDKHSFYLDKSLLSILYFSNMKKEKTQTVTEKAIGNGSELLLKNEIIGIVLLFIAIFFIFSVVSYTPTDPSFFNSTPDKYVDNYGGRTGAQVAAVLFNLCGYSTYVFLFYQLFLTSFFLLNKKIRNVITKSAGYLLLLVSFASFISNVKPYSIIDNVEIKSGGMIGYFLNGFLQGELKQFFSALLFLVLIFISLILIAKLSLRKIAAFIARISIKAAEKITLFVKEQYAKYEKWRRIKRIQEKYNQESKTWNQDNSEPKTFNGQPDPEPGKSGKTSWKDKRKRQVVRKPSKMPEEGSLFSDFGDV